MSSGRSMNIMAREVSTSGGVWEDIWEVAVVEKQRRQDGMRLDKQRLRGGS